MSDNQSNLLRYLSRNGASSSVEIQAALKVSQATVSRLVAALSAEIVKIGSGRSSAYAAARLIGNDSAQQPIWVIDETGAVQRAGTLTYLERSEILVQADGLSTLFVPTVKAELPWYLMPLRAQGFLGQMLAQSLAAHAVDSNPERWGTTEILLGALFTHDAPGALLLGHSAVRTAPEPALLALADLGASLDAFAQDLAGNQVPGSSAGGEQPKFLARMQTGARVLIKFSPPRATPFGERWGDLLIAEALCSASLAEHGFRVAATRVVQTDSRTYLLSERFDRVGASGRRHVVSVGAAHSAWVQGSYSNWSSTCDALQRQGRLGQQDASAVSDIAQFGRLIGNSDMHSGNASLFVIGRTLAEISEGQFVLAPVYDMLPMRWRPSRDLGLPEYAAFAVSDIVSTEIARSAARHFWSALAQHAQVSAALRQVAQAMAEHRVS